MAEFSNAFPLDRYRALIALNEPFVAAAPVTPSEYAVLLREALEHLERDDTDRRLSEAVCQVDDLRSQLRVRLTVRGPEPLPSGVLAAIDAILQTERKTRPTVDARTLPRFALPGRAASTACALWQGDITTLAVDAIVNAANSALLGCFRPNHACIDNAVHSAAGPRLREDCARIMQAQGTLEPTCMAKATRAYNLPSKFVLHTVGPIVEGALSPLHMEYLARVYRACLDTAVQIGGVRAVAFCGVSTGVFGFPRGPAARIALRAVGDWLEAHPGALDLVVFNVFSNADRNAYVDALHLEADR